MHSSLKTLFDFIGRAELQRALLLHRIVTQLPPGQARVARALLDVGPEFEYPEPPISYATIASAFGISKSTVATHLRRISRRHPELWALIAAERSRRLALWHSQVEAERLERSRRWGKRRWAARYRAIHARWPWDDFAAR